VQEDFESLKKVSDPERAVDRWWTPFLRERSDYESEGEDDDAEAKGPEEPVIQLRRRTGLGQQRTVKSHQSSIAIGTYVAWPYDAPAGTAPADDLHFLVGRITALDKRRKTVTVTRFNSSYRRSKPLTAQTKWRPPTVLEASSKVTIDVGKVLTPFGLTVNGVLPAWARRDILEKLSDSYETDPDDTDYTKGADYGATDPDEDVYAGAVVGDDDGVESDELPRPVLESLAAGNFVVQHQVDDDEKQHMEVYRLTKVTDGGGYLGAYVGRYPSDAYVAQPGDTAPYPLRPEATECSFADLDAGEQLPSDVALYLEQFVHLPG
jgi:hypothetical protein